MSLRNKENLKWFIVFVKLSSLRNVFYGTVSRVFIVVNENSCQFQNKLIKIINQLSVSNY